MSKDPSVGMRYKDALKTATRHVKEGSNSTAEAMVRQVQAHEGDRAASEFAKEIVSKGNDQKGRKYF